ncbi:MAG: threonine synthase [Caldilineaceae bacterium]|nr:threonine synthase [Caldilineaceae bacterium]MCB0124591.1 threonine synthase [Caldilineaceae bacterium]
MENGSGLIAYCQQSGFRIAAEFSPLRCPHSAQPLEYKQIPRFDVDVIDRRRMGLWRYGAMLPVLEPGHELVTLGEGWTPLVADRWARQEVLWKIDALMPTGSYKDRGVSVMVNWLTGKGAETMVDDSSGNAGASLACYAARAGTQAIIYVPARAPEPKKAQIAIYGAELVEVPGPRSQATRAAEAATSLSRDTAYASHAWHPAFLLGQMTCAWEIWEQMGGDVPEWLVAPAGHGGLLLGIWRGFQHLYHSKIINRLPKLVAVQAIPYTPLYDAFHEEAMHIESNPRIESVRADGIAISHPVRAAALLDAIRTSQGTVVAVTDDEVGMAHERLAERGLFVEPTSATVAVAIEHLADQFAATDRVVAVLTGHGLKNPPRI